MQHQMQKGVQCFPTSLAMVVDKPVQLLVNQVLRHFNYNYYSDVFKDTRQNGIECELYLTRKYTPSITKQLMQAFSDSPKPLKYRLDADLSGRGIIICDWATGSHAIAFHDNMLYDPGWFEELPRWIWLDLWRGRAWPSYQVLRVSKT